MLPTLNQRYDKKSFHFCFGSRTRDCLKFYRLSDATFDDRINTIYQFIKPFLDKKSLFFEDYGAFKCNKVKHYCLLVNKGTLRSIKLKKNTCKT